MFKSQRHTRWVQAAGWVKPMECTPNFQDCAMKFYRWKQCGAVQASIFHLRPPLEYNYMDFTERWFITWNGGHNSKSACCSYSHPGAAGGEGAGVSQRIMRSEHGEQGSTCWAYRRASWFGGPAKDPGPKVSEPGALVLCCSAAFWSRHVHT